jgi:hypothetical protein
VEDPAAPANTAKVKPAAQPAPATSNTQQKKDRHAITEKGVPASKTKTAPAPKPVEQKKAAPGARQ